MKCVVRRSARNWLSLLVGGAVLCCVVPQASAIIDAALQMQLGNPSNATADTNNHDHYLIERTVQALDYNDSLGLPNWASWNLTPSDLGTNSRSTSFFTDTNLPPDFYRVKTGDYTHSGYDRGHMCPSADRTDTEADNDMVFFMSNIIPQASVNNSGVWGTFEGYCRALAQTNELLIICGPSGFDGSLINTNGPVFIPAYTWKIVVVVSLGEGTALSRITNSTRVIALKIPNTDEATNTWPFYVTSANQIQVDTGFTFFTALPDELASDLRNKVDGQTNPPPVILAFSPTNGAANTCIVITGTNFESAVAVTVNGTSALFSVDSATKITATLPANACSGLISVTTPSGTALSSNSFTVKGDGIYSGVLSGWDVSGFVGGANNFGPSPMTPTTNAPNVTVVGLTRGAGVGTNGSAAARTWGGGAFINTTATAAVDSSQIATFSIAADAGYKVSFSSISKFDYRRSGTGPANGVMQYQIGPGAFTDLTNLSWSVSASSGGSIGAIDLSGVAALQNVNAGTIVTFRIVNYGGTSSSGTWYVFDVADNSAPDLAIAGTVAPVNSPPPLITAILTTNGTALINLQGVPGFTYSIQAATNLNSSADWQTIGASVTGTNGLFQFIDAEAANYPARYYRLALP
jgi:DNA/RNA endonuclease G (NUC1)